MGAVKINNLALAHDYPKRTETITSAVVEVNQPTVNIELSALSKEEVLMLLDDLDSMFDNYMHEPMAKAVAAEVPNIIHAVRWANNESKNGYGGFGSKGGQLVAEMLRPVHVGNNTITNNANTASKGLYAGTNNAVYSWTNDFTGGTSATVIPSQVMGLYAAMLHIGVADNVDLPPVDGVRFGISGVNTSVMSLGLAQARRAMSGYDVAFQKLKKPVLIGPLKTHVVDYFPWYTGTGRTQLVSIVVAKSENLTA